MYKLNGIILDSLIYIKIKTVRGISAESIHTSLFSIKTAETKINNAQEKITLELRNLNE